MCIEAERLVSLLKHSLCNAANLTYPLYGFQTAYTIPILAFAFVCHPEVLPIYTELKK